MDYKSICFKVQDIARRAGEYIASQREGFCFDRVEFKGVQNMVSYVDKEAEKMIVAGLRELLPDSGFITEEGTAARGNEQLTWIIDPLDGTTNFIHGLPPYCVSIALNEGEKTVVGVVYEVTHKEMFYAWEGSDAYMNDCKISVAPTDKLENALVAVGLSYNVLNSVENFLEVAAFFQKNTNGIRRLGSATADLVYVACGRFDAYFQAKLASWDVAAGAFIALRAGAVVTDYSGGDNYIFGGEIIASSPKIYDDVKKNIG